MMSKTIISPEIFLIATLSAVSLLYIFLAVRHFRMVRKFRKVTDVEDTVKKEKERLAAVKDELLALSNDSAQQKQTYDSLKKQLAILEEDSEFISFGLYKPVFRYKNAVVYQTELERIYDQQKQMIRDGTAVNCRFTISLSLSATAGASKYTSGGSSYDNGKKLMQGFPKIILRAFNGEVDLAIAQVSWSNVAAKRERIINAFNTINKTGELLAVRITDEYKETKIKELELVFEYEEKQREEKEEQRIKRRKRQPMWCNSSWAPASA